MATLNAKTYASNDDAINYYTSLIDEKAEQTRLKFLTAGAGQSMTYDQKYAEALAGGGTMIDSEALALDMSVSDVIDSVLAARAAWIEKGAEIESERLKAKKQIRQASTAHEMHLIASSAFTTH